MVLFLEILIIILLSIIIYQLISFFNQVSDKDLFIERLIKFLKFIRLPVVLIILYALGMHINFIIAILFFAAAARIFKAMCNDNNTLLLVLIYLFLFVGCIIIGIGIILFSSIAFIFRL